MKEKLPGHESKAEEVPATVYTTTTKLIVTTMAGPGDQPRADFIEVEHHQEQHRKKEKGFVGKIKDKLPATTSDSHLPRSAAMHRHIHLCG